MSLGSRQPLEALLHVVLEDERARLRARDDVPGDQLVDQRGQRIKATAVLDGPHHERDLGTAPPVPRRRRLFAVQCHRGPLGPGSASSVPRVQSSVSRATNRSTARLRSTAVRAHHHDDFFFVVRTEHLAQ